MPKTTKYDAIIIGAGLSGLTAAETLIAAGKTDIHVLEERKVIGGRIRTYKFDDNTVLEGGPSYIGPNQPHMQALVKRFKLRLEGHGIAPGALGINHLNPEGWPPAIPLGLLAFDASKATHQDLANARRGIHRLEVMARKVAIDNLEAPWESSDRTITALDQQTLAEWAEAEFANDGYTPIVKVYVQDMLRMFVRSVLSAELEDMSALYFFWYMARCGGFRAMTEGGVRTGPDSLRVTTGFYKLLKRIAKPFKDRIQLGAQVTKVTQSTNKAIVHLADGTELRAKRVIVAVPPFACNRIEFPDCERVKLHNAMGSGRMFKGYVRYPTSWWKTFTDSQAEFDSRNDKTLSGEFRPRKHAAGYSGYTNGTEHPVVWTMPATWTGASPQHGHELHDEKNPALLWFVVGAEYDKLKDLEPEQRQLQIRKTIESLHAKSKPDYYPAHTQPGGKPWYLEHDLGLDTEHNFGGPSGLLGVGGLWNYGKLLRASTGRIHWASTETAVRWGGYMDGAVEAGIRAAYEVLGARRPRPPRGYPSTVDPWLESPKIVTKEVLAEDARATAFGMGPDMASGKPMAGFAMTRLEVEDGLYMAGYGPMAEKGVDEGEPLQARALYLRGDDGSEVVFCAVDLMSASTMLTERVTRALRGLLPTPRASLVLSGTHTHTAPGRYFGNSFYDAFAQSVLPNTKTDTLLVRTLVQSIIACIREAVHGAVPAKFGVGRSELWGMSTNRSLPAFEANPESEKYGRQGWQGPVAPDGLDDRQRAVDPRVTAIAAFDDRDELVGAFCVFGCHATSLGVKHKGYSRDWPGVAADYADQCHARESTDWRVRELVPARFAIASGASGDVSPLPAEVLATDDDVEDWQNKSLRKFVGESVATKALEAVAAAKRAKVTSLAVKAFQWNPLRNVGWYHAIGAPLVGGAEDAQSIGRHCYPEGTVTKDPLTTVPKDSPHYPKKMLPGSEKLFREFPLSATHSTHTVRIGDDAILTVPGEPTVFFSHRLTKSMGLDPERTTVVGYTGDYCGYFTTPEEFCEQHYEGASTLYGRETLTSFVKDREPLVETVPSLALADLYAPSVYNYTDHLLTPDAPSEASTGRITHTFKSQSTPTAVTLEKKDSTSRPAHGFAQFGDDNDWIATFIPVADADVGGWELYVDGELYVDPQSTT